MQLGQAQPVRVLDDQGVHVGDVDAGFDDGGAHQHLNFAVGHLLHHGAELPLGHFPVGNADGHVLPQPLAQPPGSGLDVLHPVVQVINLAAPAQLPADGLSDDGPLMLHHIGLHRLAVVGRLLDGAHVPDAGQGHVQGPGDRGGGQGQGVHLLGPLPELLLVGHAEALLLVDDQQAQVVKFQVLLQ